MVRIDGNVPLQGTSIANDYRLQAMLPTLEFIKKHGGTIVLVTHIGRPKKPSADLSTIILQPWFEKRGFTITFASNIENAYKKSLEKNHDIILLENIRFFSGEKDRDPSFAQDLATLGEYYVNDAFATLHRNDTSVTLVATKFEPEYRTIGLLVEKEIKKLSLLLNTQQKQPFLVILGGGKPETKIPVISAFLNYADMIILCPALVFTFNKALGKEVGKSLVDDSLFDTAKLIVKQSTLGKTELFFPTDYQVLKESLNGPIINVSQKNFPKDVLGVSLGLESLHQIQSIIKKAGTIFFNCAMGFSGRKDTQQGSITLLQTIVESHAYSIVAGGNSVDLIFQAGLEEKIDYLSTGGGAALYYLAGKKLPGLDILYKYY